jgi:tetratricopeptide (TPR) repeat protein
MLMKFGRSITIIALLAIFFLGIPVSANSGDTASLIGQGNALVKTKNYSQAIEAYDQAISLDKGNFEAWNGKADALNRAQKFTEALAASDTALALEPSRASGWINRGYILYNLGRFDDELKAYETAVSLEPGNAQAWFNEGYSLAGMKRYDEAIAAFDKVQTLQPDYPYLEANRHTAEQLRAASKPLYIQYAPVMIGILLLLAILGLCIIYRKKKRIASDDTVQPDKKVSQKRRQ